MDNFDPACHPKYSISRILEFGDPEAVAWMRTQFSEEQIKEVIRTDRSLSPKSANFWALVYGIRSEEVKALRTQRAV